jgi:enoyl-CoA hydratase/carnithine racemase
MAPIPSSGLAAERFNPFPRIEDVDVSAFNYRTFKWQTINTEVEDNVLTVRLDRPKNMNAFNGNMVHELVFAFELADADDRVKAVVLTGTGKAFCAGADLQSGGFATGGDGQIHRHRDGGGQVALAILNCRKLTIGAINGSAVGIGMTMILPLDIRFVAEK